MAIPLLVILTPAEAQGFLYPFSISSEKTAADVDPGGVTIYEIIVKNDGYLPEIQRNNISISGSSVVGWSVVISPQELNLDAGESAVVDVLIYAPANAPAGMSVLHEVTATSSMSSDAQTLSFNTTVRQVYGLEISSNRTSATGKAGEIVRYEISVSNRGNGNDVVELNLSGEPEWQSVISPTGILLKAGEMKKAELQVTIPADQTDVASKEITIRATSAGGRSYNLTVSVFAYAAPVPDDGSDDADDGQDSDTETEPQYTIIALGVLASLIILTLALILLLKGRKKADIELKCDEATHVTTPGSGTVYILEVKNKSRRRETVRIGVSTPPAGWNARVDEEEVILASGESHVVKLHVDSPKNAGDGSSCRVTVNAILASNLRRREVVTHTVIKERKPGLRIAAITNDPQYPIPKDGVHTKVRVESSDNQDTTTTIKLFVDGELKGSKRIVVPAWGTAEAKFLWLCFRHNPELKVRLE
ncbi:MAG: hypothetical protein CVT48_05550 [Thermoplasmata archaeon HGW-Thermoplasmata-1]|nr:MAG: hypothetical protein CVT48_05550 [Thermoplasmata archaeon HGW-Thermoplasmata-1]